MARLHDYYELTKPGIVWSNTLTVVAGFLLASNWHIFSHFSELFGVVVGTALVIACACVVNNYIDRGIDAKMARTRKRALVMGDISASSAITFAVILAVLGFVLLIKWTNWLTVIIGALAWLDYVILYGWAKRYTVYSTLIGTLCGAASVVAGYTAVIGTFDFTALSLLLVLVAWQMPHFYGIAMYRRDDYKAAGLPVITVSRGMHEARVQSMVYIVLFIVAGILLQIATGSIIGPSIIIVAGLAWFGLGYKWWQQKDVKWGRRMFFTSLFVNLLMVLAVAIS